MSAIPHATASSSETDPLSGPRDEDLEQLLQERLGKLDLPSKVRLLTGATFWALPADDTIGLRKIEFSDGPAGVRGDSGDERKPSLNLPSGSALGATWDTDVARRYGGLLGQEAVRKEIEVVLGPTINLHRSPYGGRHFEAMAEDPLLTGHLAAAVVEGIQSHGVAACPKHYVANDYEIDRFTASSEVDDRTLRELYLAAFEDAVVDAKAWTIMSAYNSVNGTTMTEHDLLRTPLKTEWGFDGVVVSDWMAVRSVDAAANGAQDVVMPSEFGPWGDALVEAVREGRVEESAIDEKVLRVLRLAARVGALDGVEQDAGAPVATADPLGLITELGAEGMVLLRNEGELPWGVAPASIAVIGPNALYARSQGGGSATVMPERVISPLEGLRERFPDAEITFAMGVEAPTGVFPFDRDRLHDPIANEPGVHLTILDAEGALLVEEVRTSAELIWLGTLPAGAATMTLTTRFTPATTERCDIGVYCAGRIRLDVDGATVIDAHHTATSEGFDISRDIFAPPVSTFAVETVAGTPVDVVATSDLTSLPLPMLHAITLGVAPRAGTAEEMLADAVRAAAESDVAVVLVGTSARTETEGIDRDTLAMPGAQDDLVAAIRAANPRTVVVVNAGSPVILPWHQQVSAVLLTWFGGQQTGTALAEVLAGDREPGGRLPTTWPGDEASVPLGRDIPVDGKVHYDEGIEIGHRAWLRAGRTPAFAFGHGLGYTTWTLSDAEVTPTVEAGGALTVRVAVENTGERAGKQVVQVYASRADSDVLRPVRWLVGWGVARLAAGERTTLEIEVPSRTLAAWVDGAWTYEPGAFALQIGTSVDDLPLAGSVELK
ncbi:MULTISPECIES: beta-glucosidase family protein [unclassified Nocardioides]|uniref:beta-glucosidase family protein n=1 Tax=unclassified Nocardioides TaxID=2615069 RepID=UPI0006F7A3E5|nr:MULTISPECIES: glycoside hydrolase family 3 C-terminal domain-containing protein [unclassified Nocardioides]KRA38498.1 beta-glucosidase [Nocardioides sp. Root614]KRA92458.1 beta-glucosidase [Nocardioides sp. Root682]